MEGRATFARYKNRLILLLAAVMLLCICGFLTACQNKKEPGTSDEFINEPIRQEDVFHDIGEPYVSHIEPTDADTMTVRLRVRHGNITEAALVYTSHLEYENSADCAWEAIKMSFEKTDANRLCPAADCSLPVRGRKSSRQQIPCLRWRRNALFYPDCPTQGLYLHLRHMPAFQNIPLSIY